MRSADGGRAQLIESQNLSARVKHYTFEIEPKQPFEFQAGQYLCLTREVAGNPMSRYFSVASWPDGSSRFELCADPKPEKDPFGRYLWEMSPGQEVDYRGPAGTFSLSNPPRHSLFIASGTGIAPIRSMLGALLFGPHATGGDRRIALLYGARDPEGLFFHEEFLDWENQGRGFHFVPTLSRPNTGWSGRIGYVQTHLAELLDGHAPASQAYLCGPPEMVKQTADQLRQLGMAEESILFERYG